MFVVVSLLLQFSGPNIHGDQVFESNSLSIPLAIHLVKDSEKELSTKRDSENVNKLIEEVNRIWRQANIEFYIKTLYEEEYSTQEIIMSRNNPSILKQNFDPTTINAYLIKEIGVNGIAYPPLNVIMVADFTTVNDYRAFAHEIGHVLNLQHVPPSNRLLAQGRNGEILTEMEIEIARMSAKSFSSNK